MSLLELTLQGLLSFGPDTPPLKMRPLNVLIGPNGSGKSNLIEALTLLQAAPKKLSQPTQGKGRAGVGEWIWKGDPAGHARIDAVVDNPSGSQPLRHVLEFKDSAATFDLIDEKIENRKAYPGKQDVYSYYRLNGGNPVLSTQAGLERPISRENLLRDESILSQRKDPETYPALSYLSNLYGSFKMYRNWSFGRKSVFRSPQPADMPSDQLEEDFSNLGLFLNRLRETPDAKKTIIAKLSDLYAGLDDFDIRVKGGTVEVFLTEGDFIIPASRLSDGTLRYLCLLAILCNPEPPPLLCVEEPELGLHPDIIPKIADLLVEASERTQLVVTTHSDILVDALSEQPESVVVVEKHDARTSMRRLETAELAKWLEKYRLGQLWTRGQIGGTRW